MEHAGPQGEPHRQRALPRRPRSVRRSRHRGPLGQPGLRRDNAEGREKNALAQPQPGTSPPPSGRGPAREGESGAKQREAKAITPRRGRPHLPPLVPPPAGPRQPSPPTAGPSGASPPTANGRGRSGKPSAAAGTRYLRMRCTAPHLPTLQARRRAHAPPGGPASPPSAVSPAPASRWPMEAEESCDWRVRPSAARIKRQLERRKIYRMVGGGRGLCGSSSLTSSNRSTGRGAWLPSLPCQVLSGSFPHAGFKWGLCFAHWLRWSQYVFEGVCYHNFLGAPYQQDLGLSSTRAPVGEVLAALAMVREQEKTQRCQFYFSGFTSFLFNALFGCAVWVGANCLNSVHPDLLLCLLLCLLGLHMAKSILQCMDLRCCLNLVTAADLSFINLLF